MDAAGDGTMTEQRLYQRVRPEWRKSRIVLSKFGFSIRDVQAYTFTFG
jgi:hypothetical protein